MTRRVWAHLALAALGLAAVVWVFTAGAHPTIACRGVEMGPADVCANAEGTRVQTYAERLDAAQAARPVVGGVGSLIAAFAVTLAVADLRRAGSSGRTPPGPPPAG